MSKYISLEAALEECDWYASEFSECEYAIMPLKGALENLPAADVRPVVKAHWYWDKDGMDWGIGAWRCSACKAMSPMRWNADRGSPMHKSGNYYCPNCGADMMEER